MSKPVVRSSVGTKLIQELQAAEANRVSRKVPSLPAAVEDTTRRRRIEVLDLREDDELSRWQVLHNDTDRYEVVSEKFSQIKGNYEGEHTCTIIYNEIGEGLPLIKSKAELRSQDNKAQANSKNSSVRAEVYDFES